MWITISCVGGLLFGGAFAVRAWYPKTWSRACVLWRYSVGRSKLYIRSRCQLAPSSTKKRQRRPMKRIKRDPRPNIADAAAELHIAQLHSK
jgi:hypothetical protein